MGAGKALRDKLRSGNWCRWNASAWRIKMCNLWGRTGAPVLISVGLWFNAEFRLQECWWGCSPHTHVYNTMRFFHRLSTSAARNLHPSLRPPGRYCRAQPPDQFQNFIRPCEGFRGRLSEGGVGSEITRSGTNVECAFALLIHPLGWRFRKSIKVIMAKNSLK